MYLIAIVLTFLLFGSTDARKKRDGDIPSFDSLDTDQWRSGNRVRDVCVLGAGASGMSAAVF